MENELESLFDAALDRVDSDLAQLAGLEEERQRRKLILIASESICFPAVREALRSSFTNLYAEGYPSTRMSRDEADSVMDFVHHLAYSRRYGDRRYYRGCDYVNVVESLARKRVRELFATESVPAERLFANVQPLSGAAANNAVYEAFLEPGDTVMGMALTHGGHLTHGSEANRSGKLYQIAPYEASRATGRLDYDALQQAALEARPKMIIAGYSAYPWSVDWAKLREIADSVPGGCILMADIAHPAGLVVAGQFPNPVGYAHVITFTTHKTLCGPRGAVILTTDEERAKRIDTAVFPGEQGGPHVHAIAAKAVAFKIAQTEGFRQLQKRIVDNAQALAEGLTKRGLKLAYGGTDTHMLLIDLKGVKCKGRAPLRGEIASRILDLCGITCNKNTITGDDVPIDPGAIRLGTTWVSQLGMGADEMDRIAELVANVLSSVVTFSYVGQTYERGRGKVPPNLIADTRERVSELLGAPSGGDANLHYPHGIGPEPVQDRRSPLLAEHKEHGGRVGTLHGRKTVTEFSGSDAEAQAAKQGAALFDCSDAGTLLVRGERAGSFLHEVCTSDVLGLETGSARRSFLLDREAQVLDDVTVLRTGADDFIVLTNPENSTDIASRLRLLSDGYVLFDEDPYMKIQGPVSIVDAHDQDGLVYLALQGPNAEEALVALGVEPPPASRSVAAELCGTTATIARVGLAGGSDGFTILTPAAEAAAVWNALLSRGVTPAGAKAHAQLRKEAGLPVYRHRGQPPDALGLLDQHASMFQPEKPYFIGQCALAAQRAASALTLSQSSDPDAEPGFVAPEEEGELRKTPLYEEHLELTGRAHLVPFAGWSMPVCYTTIADEHRATRESAALFDVAHMGVLEVKGTGATRFLDVVTTNYVPKLRLGQSHYSYLLAPTGEPLDDILIYRMESERYLLVVNAVNATKVKAWLDAVNSRAVAIDVDDPAKRVDCSPVIRDLKDPECGPDQLIDLALQGPRSLALLTKLVGDAGQREQLASLRKFTFVEVEVDGIPLIASRTGYTGEEIGFELLVHPDRAAARWCRLLEAGQELGVKPAGLGARDSTRIEAGLPLYGHELAGQHGISPMEAGYGAFVKLHKPFFIGRATCLEKHLEREMTIVRFQMDHRGIRAIKPDDPVVDGRGNCIGLVTSCTLVEGVQTGLAYVRSAGAREGATIGVFPLPRDGSAPPEKPRPELQVRDRALLHETGTILTRFRTP